MQSPAAHVDPTWAWRPYTPTTARPWNRELAAHLYRRAAFGGTLEELHAAVRQEPGDVVEQLLRGESSPHFRDESGALVAAVLATGDPRQLAAWWAHEIVHTPHPLLERMTLFWHGHFATSAAKVADAQLMWQQNQLLRRHALGSFAPMVRDVARDPAMLIYLDSATNRKARPNENFARELMELFSLGEGCYSEQDVQELARCFTGWEVKLKRFRFNRFQHDPDAKSILGKTAPFTDDASIDWLLEQPSAAEFIAGKLYRQFICDEPAPDPPLLAPLATELRDHDFSISRVVKRILSSELFFSVRSIGRKVRSPVDLALGILRSLDGSANMHELTVDLEKNGQGLFYPPNVKGWDGGRAWINSATLLGRANMMSRLLNDKHTRFGGGSLEEYFAKRGAKAPDEIIDLASQLLLASPLASDDRSRLVELCQDKADGNRGITQALAVMATLPQMQLG